MAGGSLAERHNVHQRGDVREQPVASERLRNRPRTSKPPVVARGNLRPMAKVPAAVRAYLAKIGAKGGKHASGAGGRALWADVPAAERSRRMRDLVRKRWARRK